MTSILKRLAALFNFGLTPDSSSTELEAYLSRAQSLVELENLQRQWDRDVSRRSLFYPMTGVR